ncbi:hypothetical protein E4U41_002816 [Claviceps citrina]|nr:hypothetical protein E4U41_002816 [Claviceps citrina]
MANSVQAPSEREMRVDKPGRQPACRIRGHDVSQRRVAVPRVEHRFIRHARDSHQFAVRLGALDRRTATATYWLIKPMKSPFWT